MRDDNTHIFMSYDGQETDIAELSPPIPLRDIESLDELAFKRLQLGDSRINAASLIKKIQNAQQDADVYSHLAQLLTAISLSMSGDDNMVLAFIVTPGNVVKTTEDNLNDQKPDVIGISLPAEVAKQVLVNADFQPSSVTAYSIRAPVEAKQEAQELSQYLRYITFTHIHRPQAIVSHGLSVTKQYVMLRSVALCSRKDGEKTHWKDNVEVVNLLRRFIELVRQENTDTSLTLQTVIGTLPFPIFQFKAGDGRLFSLWSIYHGWAGGRKPYVAIGIPSESEVSKHMHVFKFSWTSSCRRWREAAILRKIHSKGPVPGVVRLNDPLTPSTLR